MIKKFSSPKIKIWFEPMFFSGFFCGFERCGSAAFPNFRGGIFSEKCVRTNSRILHQTGKVKFLFIAEILMINIMENSQNEIECIITGRVQMVMFRDFACRRARRLGLTGTVQNLSDSSVRVIAQGEKAKLAKFIELLKKGSLLSKVENVQVTWHEPGAKFAGFKILY